MLPAPKLIRKKERIFFFLGFAGIQRDFARITVHCSSELLLRAFWKKKKSKVPKLKEIETLGRSIEKIETLVAKLKIAANFRR
jgi:hypothetical protein